jgi:hypothetical protein
MALKAPNGYHITIFREPRLESGYPDLVIVIWKTTTVSGWALERTALTVSDLRLLHNLALCGRSSEQRLKDLFGTAVSRRLQRLWDARMIRPWGPGIWQILPLNHIYAVRSIVAIEAKMSANSSALDQADLNTWFASESYVLLPRIPHERSSFIDAARRKGIGVWTNGVPSSRQRAFKRTDLPRSYVSWLFNEWAWAAAIRATNNG